MTEPVEESPTTLAMQALTTAALPHLPLPCHQDHADVWFTDRPDEKAAAVLACEGCPVRAECLDYALLADERFGVWGGLITADRIELRATLKLETASTAPPPQHGQEANYSLGCRCALCKRAHARRIADWRRRRENGVVSTVRAAAS